MKERQHWIDVCKGIAIILVVTGHVVTSYHNSGLYIDTPAFNGWGRVIYAFHMPLFFIVSGYLTKFSKAENIIKRKLISYGIPYVVFSLLIVVLKILANRFVNNKLTILDFIKIIWFPITSLWFVYALLIISVLHYTVGSRIKTQGRVSESIYIVILFSIMLIAYYINDNKLFPNTILQDSILIDCMMYAGWFELGAILPIERIIKTSGEESGKRRKKLLTSLLLFVAYIVFVLWWMQVEIDFAIISIILALIGSLLIISISSSMTGKESTFFEYLGRNTMPIYLLHAYVVSAMRILLSLLHLQDRYGIVPIVLITVGGIFASLVIYNIIKRCKVIDFCFYPLKYMNQRQ